MSTTAELLVQAEGLRRAGRLADAQHCCQQALAAVPTSAPAHNVLGQIMASAGRLDLAETCFRQALACQGDHVQSQGNLGVTLHLQGKAAEAAVAFRRAIELAPGNAELHRRLAGALEDSGAREEAISSCRRAVALLPVAPESHNSLGVLLGRHDRLDEAVACLREAVRLKPDFADAYCNLGATLDRQGNLDEAHAALMQALALQPTSLDAHINLGALLEQLGRNDEALLALRRAVALAPDSLEACLNLGLVLERQNQADEAEACYRRGIEIKPDSVEAHNLYAVNLARRKKLSEAEAALRRVVQMAPDRANSHGNLGSVLMLQGKLDEALASLEHSAELDPNRPETQVDIGLIYEKQGRMDLAEAAMKRAYADTWRQHEWRFRWERRSELARSRPRWKGEPLAGKSILIGDELGFGDALQCIRYADVLKQQGARVIFQCRQELVSLMERFPAIDQVISTAAELPDFDTHLALCSLPEVLGETPDKIPQKNPYLFADPALVARWKAELGGGQELKIGIAWQGNPAHKTDRFRSIPLERFAPLAALPGVQLVSLQAGTGREQLANLTTPFAITDLGDRLGDFQNTAAILCNLDLIITCDSVAAHLAGALGLPVWVALMLVPDQRWLLVRNDSPWYPTMRLYRQTRSSDWEEVFARIAADLAAFRAEEIFRADRQ